MCLNTSKFSGLTMSRPKAWIVGRAYFRRWEFEENELNHVIYLYWNKIIRDKVTQPKIHFVSFHSCGAWPIVKQRNSARTLSFVGTGGRSRLKLSARWAITTPILWSGCRLVISNDFFFPISIEPLTSCADVTICPKFKFSFCGVVFRER